MAFSNRKQAGQALATRLLKYKEQNPIVLALPRGGVPVAFEIAMTLGAQLEVLAVRKIGAPFNSELAVGAVCENDDPIWNERVLAQMGLEPDDMNSQLKIEKGILHQQINKFRIGRDLPDLTQRTIIVVDDGLATGATVAAAVKFLKKIGSNKIVAAIPIAATQAVRTLKEKVDELVVLEERSDLSAVSQGYEDFSQVTDEEVLAFLKDVNATKEDPNLKNRIVYITLDDVTLEGELTTLKKMKALIIFVHGSGSSRKSIRNKQVAHALNKFGFGTLLIDMLTEDESQVGINIFDIEFLSHRLILITRWIRSEPELKAIPFGFFGASTGAAAAIQAAHFLEHEGLYAVVSRGGRPDLAGPILSRVKIPILLLVGSLDVHVIKLNRVAQQSLANSLLLLIPGATHLFEEPGALEKVAQHAIEWFTDHLPENLKLSGSMMGDEQRPSSQI